MIKDHEVDPMTHRSDILVNTVKQRHECQTKRQQWSEAAHCGDVAEILLGEHTDPCGVLKALHRKYTQILAGHNVYLMSP